MARKTGKRKAATKIEEKHQELEEHPREVPEDDDITHEEEVNIHKVTY